MFPSRNYPEGLSFIQFRLVQIDLATSWPVEKFADSIYHELSETFILHGIIHTKGHWKSWRWRRRLAVGQTAGTGLIASIFMNNFLPYFVGNWWKKSFSRDIIHDPGGCLHFREKKIFWWSEIFRGFVDFGMMALFEYLWEFSIHDSVQEFVMHWSYASIQSHMTFHNC